MTASINPRRPGRTGGFPARIFSYALLSPCFLFLLVFQSLLFHPGPVPAATYAERQLSAFVKSRPGTEEVVTQAKGVHEFLLEAFAGLHTSVPLAWDSHKPNDNAYAEHKPSLNRKVINIRVSNKLSPLDQVACLVYEAINAQNEKQFIEYSEQASNGDLNRSEFILNILSLEHKSLKRTRAFLAKESPFKDVVLSETVFYGKMYGTPEKFEDFIEYLHRIKREDYDVFKHYSDFYDFIVPPTRRWKIEHKALAADSGEAPPAKRESTGPEGENIPQQN